MLKASVSDFKDVSRMELEEILQDASNSNKYSENAKKMEERGKNALSMLADETLAHVLQNNLDSSQDLQSPYTDNQTILFIANKLKSSINEERRRSINKHNIRRETPSSIRSQESGTENVGNQKGKPGYESVESTKHSTRHGGSRRSGEEQAGGIAPITQAANRTAGSLHLDNVTILSEEDLASLTPKQQRAKGWFDPKTGHIYINASNHANEADVVQTVLHEAVAHFGLRALFGKDFDTMLDRVYRAAGSALYDANINHLYVCEVFLASKIENGNTLQTAASQPHGGIALYKDILANVLDTANVAQSFDTSNTLQRKHARLMYPSSAKQLSRL